MPDTEKSPLFADLVFNEADQPVETASIGGEPFYAVPDDDFLRHVEAEYVDRQIVKALQEHLRGMKHVVTEGVIQMLGEETLFTRPSIEHAIENMDRILEPGVVDADQLRTALWMAGFRAVIDVHGDLVRLEVPAGEDRPTG
jgi:hypothetical protein